MQNEFTNGVLTAFHSLEKTAEPDSHILYFGEEVDYDIGLQDAERMFHKARQILSTSLGVELVPLKAGDANFPKWLAGKNGATICERDGRVFVLYWHYDEPFTVVLYA